LHKITSIHQPGYFPWLGYVDKVYKSDIFIILDNVQLNDAAFQNRNIFIDNQGTSHYLTIPVSKKEYLNKTIKELKLTNIPWQKKHFKFLFFNYKKHPYFDEVFSKLEFIYNKKYTYLIDVLIDSMDVVFKLFDIKNHILFASDLNLNNELKKEELILGIIKSINADIYLSGQGAKSYQKEENFKKNNIKLTYQQFIHPTYNQLYTQKFISGLSSLDLLFNEGIENSKKILKGIQ